MASMNMGRPTGRTGASKRTPASRKKTSRIGRSTIKLKKAGVRSPSGGPKMTPGAGGLRGQPPKMPGSKPGSRRRLSNRDRSRLR